jgi:Tol biopolymer transport system component
MMKNCTTFIFFILSALVFAQPGSLIYLIGSNNDVCMNPVYSPDGNKIAYTKASYKGLWFYDKVTNTHQQISNDDASGFAFKWSYDSKYILTRVTEYRKNRRYNALKIFDVTTGKSKQVSDYRTVMPSLPNWALFNEKVYITNGNQVEFFETGIHIPDQQMRWKNPDIVFVADKKISSMNLDSKIQSFFMPIKDAEYINLSVSPDNKMIVFEVVGGNMYTMNIDGTNLTDLGRGNRPRWSSDSKKIIYMIAEDDGYSVTASDIYSINANGTEKKNLTDSNNLVEMNPCFSPDGKMIAFDVLNDGSIYLMEIE